MKQYRLYIAALSLMCALSVIYLITAYNHQNYESDFLTLSGIGQTLPSIKEEVMMNVLSALKSLLENSF